MASFTTVYRAGVMIASGVIVVKGWQLYGPTNEQVKTFAVEAVELAQTVWNKSQEGAAGSEAPADPRLLPSIPAAPAPTGIADLAPPVASPGLLPAPAATIGPDNLSEAPLATAPPLAAADAAAANNATMSAAPNSSGRLPQLYAHLERIGGADPQLTQWGSSGELYRFCCRAKLTETSAMSRHFEAVAAEPVGAVEQVVAKLEAWRAAESGTAAIR